MGHPGKYFIPVMLTFGSPKTLVSGGGVVLTPFDTSLCIFSFHFEMKVASPLIYGDRRKTIQAGFYPVTHLEVRNCPLLLFWPISANARRYTQCK